MALTLNSETENLILETFEGSNRQILVAKSLKESDHYSLATYSVSSPDRGEPNLSFVGVR